MRRSLALCKVRHVLEKHIDTKPKSSGHIKTRGTARGTMKMVLEENAREQSEV